MSYRAEISRRHPSLLFFLVDQSASMARSWGSGRETLSESTADAINRYLRDIVIRCSKADGVRHYFDIALLGYGSKVDSALSARSLDQLPAPINEISETKVIEKIIKVEDGVGGLIEKK
jgi:hypothetical protein